MAEPIDPAHREQMKALAIMLDGLFNGDAKGEARTVGFALLVFDLNGEIGNRVNYISNGERADMLAALKEFVARAEGQAVDAAKGSVQ